MATATLTTKGQVTIPKEIREKRIKETLLALKTLSGGAKQTTNMADVTPKLIVLVRFKSGNHPFSHLGKEKLGKPVFSIDALVEILEEYKEQFVGKIYIGKRKGFMDEIDEHLSNLTGERVQYGPVNAVIDEFVKSITVS